MKMRKPERRIYEHVLKELNVEGQEVVFLDDIGANLKAAAQLGIRGIKVKPYFVKALENGMVKSQFNVLSFELML